MLKYSVLRLALLGVVAVVLYLLGLRGLPLVVAAPVLALMLSYVVLGRPRDEAAEAIAERRRARAAAGPRVSRGAEADAAAEDASFDAIPPRQARSSEASSDGEPQPE